MKMDAKKKDEDLNWIHLVQERKRGKILVNTVIALRVSP